MEYAGLVAGLGNPGDKYTGTRHNCGFIFIDNLLAKASEDGNVEELNGRKFNALLWRVKMPQLKGIWLAAKPLTFMNDSGRAIQPLLAWHNLKPGQLVVVQDELDLPLGSLRFKFGGGLAGHNGLASIAQQLGTTDFYRLRIGIGKPEHKTDVLNWVLGKFNTEDLEKIEKIMEPCLETLFIFSQKGLAAATQFAHHADKEFL